MPRASVVVFSALAAACVFGVPAHGQAVISTRSGVVHYFEGSVSVAGQPLEARLGKFASIPEGADLRTGQGRAEVLLTPGVFLRVGENSAIRMVATALADTRVELLSGSAMLDSAEPAPKAPVTLIYKSWNLRQPEKGGYRLDAEPARVVVREGEVEVSAAGGAPVRVGRGMEMPLAAVLVPEKADGELHDRLGEWAQGRADAVAADNAIAAGIQDPATLASSAPTLDGFTYFPMLGLSSFDNSSWGPYSSGLYAPQLGFSSLYLPGYAYRPMLIGLPILGLGLSGSRLPASYLPSRIGGLPGLPAAGVPIVHPSAGTPIGRSPATLHPVAPRGGHFGGRH